MGPGGDVARVAALAAGLPVSVPALTVDRQCASGLAAIAVAASSLRNEPGLLLAGGVIGAEFGVQAAQKLPPERLRLFLARIVLGVAARVAYGLTVAPSELFTIYAA